MIPQNEKLNKKIVRSSRRETREELLSRIKRSCYKYCVLCGEKTEGLEWHPFEFSQYSGKPINWESKGGCRSCGKDFKRATIYLGDYSSSALVVDCRGVKDFWSFGEVITEEEVLVSPKKFLGLF